MDSPSAKEMVRMIGPVSINREIDARGSHCPGPLMELIRGLKSAHEGEVIAVISTDLGSNTDIPLWVQKSGNELIGVEKLDAEATRFIVRKHVREHAASK
jgi:tRNA 2-thiouridine synthesizing protein A